METTETFAEDQDKVPVYPNLVTSDTPLRETPLELTRIIQVLYADVEAQINRADLKAQIALSTSAILAALVANLGMGLVTREVTKWSAIDWTVVILYSLFLTCACCSIVHALLAAYPRAIGRKDTHRGLPGLYFSGHVIQLPAGLHRAFHGPDEPGTAGARAGADSLKVTGAGGQASACALGPAPPGNGAAALGGVTCRGGDCVR